MNEQTAASQSLVRDGRQTRQDETGVMTLPLVGHGFTEASVLVTHPDVAIPVSLSLDAAWTEAWAPPLAQADETLAAAERELARVTDVSCAVIAQA